MSMPRIETRSPAVVRGYSLVLAAILIAACSRDPQPSPFEVKSGRHFNSVFAIGISSDSERIVSMDTGGTILVWDRPTGKQAGSGSFDVPLALSADGRVVIGASRSGVRILDTESGRYSEYRVNVVRWPFQAFLSADGSLALLIDGNGTQSLLNTLNGNVLRSPFAYSYGSGLKAQFSPAFSRDGSRILMASRQSPEVAIWNVENGAREIMITAHRSGIRATAFSRDASEILTVGMDNSLKRWQAGSGRLLGVYDTSKSALVNRVVFSPDKKRIYAGHSDGSITVWNSTGEIVSRLHAHEGWVECLRVSPDGRSLVSSGPDRFVRIWDLET